jgi:hypothetical protein
LAIFNVSRAAQAAATLTLDGMTELPPPTAVGEIARWVLDEAIEAETHGRRQIAEATRR